MSIALSHLIEVNIRVSRWSEAGRNWRIVRICSEIEWATLGLAVVIYGGWLAVSYWHAVLPWPVRIACGGWLIAWHSSLQHEAIHGHPTPWRRLNTSLAAWPLSLWLPYSLYRAAHLEHHATEALTLPQADPESYYRARPRRLVDFVGHGLSHVTSSLLGRMLLGPPILVGRFWATEAQKAATNPNRLWLWAAHAGLAACVLGWIVFVCRMSVGEYVLTFVYPGAALTLLRSFAEHRALPDKRHRMAVVERAPVLGLLFLFNNLHALHHERPGLAWYRLPQAYRRDRARLLEGNGGLVYAGYREVFARFLLRPHDRLIHPALAEEAAG